MTGLGLIILLLALVLIFSGLYLAAWFLCEVRKNPKKGHYILENDEDEERFTNKNKLYSGLDMVDEAKDGYVKNNLDLDTINENKPLPNRNSTPPPPEETSPSAPDDNNGSSNSQNQEES